MLTYDLILRKSSERMNLYTSEKSIHIYKAGLFNP
jgi:hypothetical protein